MCNYLGRTIASVLPTYLLSRSHLHQQSNSADNSIAGRLPSPVVGVRYTTRMHCAADRWLIGYTAAHTRGSCGKQCLLEAKNGARKTEFYQYEKEKSTFVIGIPFMSSLFKRRFVLIVWHLLFNLCESVGTVRSC